ncbi:MAG: glycosyltransferase family 4 protein [Kiritimatiellaceae bacterium]|nr:glycosyltransferase family 4 protein [Kiritimatiellaceae bacterium]
MHIVQILPELNQGGVERGTIELSRELILRGHQSTVISAGGSQQAQIEADGGQHITLDVCSKNPLTVPSRVAALRKTLQTLMNESAISSRKSAISTPQSALLIHARSRVPAWLSYLANKKLNLPFVTTVHGFNSVSRYSSIMTRGDRVIYGSSSIREYIVKNYSVDPSILRYVPRGIDVDAFDPAQIDEPFIRQFKQRYQLEGKTIVTMVGRITEWKGHDTFIRALADVQKQQSDVVGVIVGGIWHGKEDYFQTLEKLAADLGVTVRFTGSQSQVREIYALSHLVISAASSKAETFGRSAAEALAMNTPVIASAQGGSMDILLDRINGLLFEPGNAQDLADKILLARNHVFTNLREHIQANFSLNRMTEDELAVYRELTER